MLTFTINRVSAEPDRHRATDTHPCERCVCSICDELQGTCAPLHTKLMPQASRSRILEESRNWVVIPSIGPLAPGHIMLVPRNHYYSVLGCPKDALMECQNLLTECASRLKRIYQQDVVVFEHGSTPDQPKVCGACVDHAHLHVLPGPISFVSSAMSQYSPWRNGISLFNLCSDLAQTPYLLVGQALPKPLYWVRYCLEAVPSQILRRIFANELGDYDGWDWRKRANTTTFLRTIDDWNTA
jgi:ATP adenylyltransferase